eukprot:690472-Lingulodinium_polyedra.AAC.1
MLLHTGRTPSHFAPRENCHAMQTLATPSTTKPLGHNRTQRYFLLKPARSIAEHRPPALVHQTQRNNSSMCLTGPRGRTSRASE